LKMVMVCLCGRAALMICGPVRDVPPKMRILSFWPGQRPRIAAARADGKAGASAKPATAPAPETSNDRREIVIKASLLNPSHPSLSQYFPDARR